jgi:tetratricopeptide (TPR) repeat protein
MRLHGRYLLGALAVPAGIVALAFVALRGPWSPLALDRADARYVAGDLDGAVAAYVEVAQGWSTLSVRAEAASRAAMIHLQKGDAVAAASWLRTAAELAADPARRAALRSQLASVYLDVLRDPRRAAETYALAEVDAGDGRSLAAAAHAWERAGEPSRALEAYQQALGVLAPGETRADAERALGRLGHELSGVADAGEP